MIEVLAVGENDVLGKGGPFNLSKYLVILRCLKTVSSSFPDVQFDGHFYHSLSVNATGTISKHLKTAQSLVNTVVSFL